MELTPFGKKMRMYRALSLMSLREMAQGLGVSAALLSAAEMGKQAVSESLLNKIVIFLELSEKDAKELRFLASMSWRIKVDTTTLCDTKKRLMATLAEKIMELTQEDSCQILGILQRNYMRIA